MAVQIRYISRPENTMTIAEAIAKGTDVPAVSGTDEPELKQRADMRFPAGPPYASIMAAELRAYAKRLRRDMIHRVILVARSSGSRRTVLAQKRTCCIKASPWTITTSIPMCSTFKEGLLRL